MIKNPGYQPNEKVLKSQDRPISTEDVDAAPAHMSKKPKSLEGPFFEYVRSMLKDRGIDVAAVTIGTTQAFTAVDQNGNKSSPFIVEYDQTPGAPGYIMYIANSNSGIDAQEDAAYLEGMLKE